MEVTINGDEKELPSGATISTALDFVDIPAPHRGIAVAVNAEVVPRGEWDNFQLASGAQIEIVTAIQGG